MIRTIAVLAIVFATSLLSVSSLAGQRAEAFYDGHAFDRLSPGARSAYIAGVLDTMLYLSRVERPPARHSPTAEFTSACIRLGKVLLPELTDYRLMVENHLTVRPSVRDLSMAEVIAQAVRKECQR